MDGLLTCDFNNHTLAHRCRWRRPSTSSGHELYTIYHYRDWEKWEIDFLIERDDGDLLAVEVEIGATVRTDDFRYMRRVKDNLAGERAFVGLVLYSGEALASLGYMLFPLGQYGLRD